MPSLSSIVVVDSKGALSTLFDESMGPGARSIRVESGQKALDALDQHPAELLLVDAHLPDMGPVALVRGTQQRWPGIAVILVAESVTPSEIAEAAEAGASDLLVYPVAPAQLAFAIRKALTASRRSLGVAPPPASEAGIVFGRSPAMQGVREMLRQVAPTSSTVLIRGESGTGKELVARALHRASTRADKRLIKIDCTALPENLIESELFGYEKGAFTGAASSKPGRVELAHEGTLFLDEVGELTLPTQAKLLRLLQDREFERLGATKTLSIDVRVVAATHRDLETMVKGGSFRQDLFYRLNVLPLWIAPLRARRMDIPHLALHFCGEAAIRAGKAPIALEPAAIDVLSSQRWPGNVRQLENFVERLVVLSRSSEITAADVKAELKRPVRFVTETGTAGADASGNADGDALGAEVVPMSEAVRVAERESLRQALKCAGGNRAIAARMLGVSRSTFYSKLQEYSLL